MTGGAPGAAAAPGDQRVVEVLVGGTSVLAHALIGLALAAFAVATLWDRRYPRALSWVGAIGTLGWFVTGAALFLDLPGSSFFLVLPFSTLTTAWLLVLGVVAVRRVWRLGRSSWVRPRDAPVPADRAYALQARARRTDRSPIQCSNTCSLMVG